MPSQSTIVAISTPPGRGGIGVVRLSGREALRIASALFHPRGGRPLDATHATVGELRDTATGETIDESVATYFAAPHSYTAEDVVELSCHGSPVLLRRVVEMAIELGAQLAEPGEFTRRAFLNGRIDLTQAEAVRDLIDAQTIFQTKVAARQLHGELSQIIAPVKAELVALIARLEAGIDFAEDDVSIMPAPEIIAAIAAIRSRLSELERSFTFGRLVHDGLTLAIVGRPNVGKSSLFNRLVERDRAIVTAQAGTTRDLVTESVSLEGIPVRLVDTAGIREALDEAEDIGIRKSRQALAEADLVLVVLEAGRELDATDRQLIEEAAGGATIIVGNKADLADATDDAVHAEFDVEFPLLPQVRTSALTGLGIAELRAEILHLVRGPASHAEGAMITSLRQQERVMAAVTALAAASAAAAFATPHEMLLLDLYSALNALDELTGATTADDILQLIFSTFCIGK